MIIYYVIAAVVVAAAVILVKKKNQKKEEVSAGAETFSIKLVKPDNVNAKLTCGDIAAENQGLDNVKRGSLVTVEVDKDASIYID